MRSSDGKPNEFGLHEQLHLLHLPNRKLLVLSELLLDVDSHWLYSELADKPPEHSTNGNRPIAFVFFYDWQSTRRQTVHPEIERFPFMIWFAIASRYSSSFASILTRFKIRLWLSPSTPPLLFSTKDLMAVRTYSDVAHSGEHFSVKGTILVSTGEECYMEHSTAMTTSVRSATESAEATSRSVAAMLPLIWLALPEALRCLW